MKNHSLDSLKTCVPALLLSSILSLAGSARGAIIWNSTTDVAATVDPPTGNTFTTQTFTPSGSIIFGSNHTPADLANITLNFDGMTVNGGGLETVTGALQSNGGVNDTRIALMSTTGYSIGDELKFNWSWENQMVSDKLNPPAGGAGADAFSGDNTAGDFSEGWANLRHMFLWDGTSQFSDVVWDLMGPNVGLAANDFYDGFTTGSPASPMTMVSTDHARFTYSSISGDNNSWLNDTEDSAGDIDNFAIESLMVTATLSENISAGSNFMFTFDGISNGVPAGVIPEPSRILLLAFGLTAIFLRRRRGHRG